MAFDTENINERHPDLASATATANAARQEYGLQVYKAIVKELEEYFEKPIGGVIFDSCDEYHRESWMTSPSKVKFADGEVVEVGDLDFYEINGGVITSLTQRLGFLRNHGEWYILIDENGQYTAKEVKPSEWGPQGSTAWHDY